MWADKGAAWRQAETTTCTTVGDMQENIRKSGSNTGREREKERLLSGNICFGGGSVFCSSGETSNKQPRDLCCLNMQKKRENVSVFEETSNYSQACKLCPQHCDWFILLHVDGI